MTPPLADPYDVASAQLLQEADGLVRRGTQETLAGRDATPLFAQAGGFLRRAVSVAQLHHDADARVRLLRAAEPALRAWQEAERELLTPPPFTSAALAGLAGRGRSAGETLNLAKQAQAAALAGDTATAQQLQTQITGAPAGWQQDVGRALATRAALDAGDLDAAQAAAGSLTQPDMRAVAMGLVSTLRDRLGSSAGFTFFGFTLPWWAPLAGAGAGVVFLTAFLWRRRARRVRRLYERTRRPAPATRTDD